MGDFNIRGLNDFDGLQRLMNLFNSYLQNPEDTDYLFSEGLLTWDVSGEFPTALDIALMVDIDDDEYECFRSVHRDGCSCVWDAAHTDPRQGKVVDVTQSDERVGFIACADRGMHISVTDCWMCFCDVEFHGVESSEVLMGEPAFSRY